jgi:DNA polymerase I-like protein with 3'-5' exonuclease and polymerase domains
MHLVTKEQRQAAKSDTFKPVYGGQSGTPRQMAYYKAFRARYHKLAAVQESWVHEVLTNKGTLTTEYGLQYFWPNARMNKSGYCPMSTSIYNYPVQGFATAEIIPIAAGHFWHAVGDVGYADRIIMLNQVHDSVVCAVAPGADDMFFELARTVWHEVYSYLARAYGVKDFYVPLGTEIGLGPKWGQPVRSEKWTIWPDGREVEEK